MQLTLNKDEIINFADKRGPHPAPRKRLCNRDHNQSKHRAVEFSPSGYPTPVPKALGGLKKGGGKSQGTWKSAPRMCLVGMSGTTPIKSQQQHDSLKSSCARATLDMLISNVIR